MYLLWEAGATCNRLTYMLRGDKAPNTFVCEKREAKESDFAFLERHLQAFGFQKKQGIWVSSAGETFDGIILAVAGIVGEDGTICATNRPWKEITRQSLLERYHLKTVILMNDVQTQGLYIPELARLFAQNKPVDCVQLNHVPLLADFEARPKFLISLGTGLGACVIHKEGAVWVSEAGEYGQNLPPMLGMTEVELAPFMRVLFKHKLVPSDALTLENFVSGTALGILYQAWADKMGFPVRKERASEICKMAALAASSLDKMQYQIALKAVQSLLDVLARFIHNVGRFSLFPTGGIYLAGKVLQNPFIVDLMRQKRFQDLCAHATRTLPHHADQIPLFLIQAPADSLGVKGMLAVYRMNGSS